MDIILYNIIAAICCLFLGYIFGSIPASIVIGKVFFHQDPRDYGSKNAGGTNSGRLWGKKVGFIVIILDMIKTIAPIWICWAILTFVPFGSKPLIATITNFYNGSNKEYIIQWPVYWLAPLGTIVGHCWPVFASFKGGKGVSSFMGIACGTSWLVGFLPGLSYLLFLKAKKYVSLASICEAVIIPICFWIWSILNLTGVVKGIEWLPSYGLTLNINYVAAIVVTIMGILVIIRHHENIKRLKAGNERKITWMK
ncbi:MAG: glycerol-3-phosphate 1-O-acyltransferase PlsY [Bacilli bacterium]|nr:glycerol-3-phosphate 1-O-acyltransferase PlsY [Bacilli bacterium]